MALRNRRVTLGARQVRKRQTEASYGHTLQANPRLGPELGSLISEMVDSDFEKVFDFLVCVCVCVEREREKCGSG
eukprot:144674-Rhodomonas_salina.3